jgi:ferredoxin
VVSNVGGLDPISVELDRVSCVGSRMCTMIAPNLFQYEPNAGVSKALVDVVDEPGEIVLAREAMDSCPTAAIRLAGRLAVDSNDEILG